MSVVGEAIIKLSYDGKNAAIQAKQIAQDHSEAFSKVAGGAKAAGKAISVGLGAGLIATKATIGAVAGAAFGLYKEFEQLSGGIETLYGDASETMMQNAQNAFKTAGMSANEYMQTATNFAASLIQSLGGDTQKAAAYADRAIQDMSDNANKMGTDIERIQDAYRGFARGQFNMLDNLSLGYAGTRSEMQRLLSDAEKISGKKFDISSYADITEAIHIIQQEMGIAGTTAEEAGATIEGSLKATKAAWANLLTDIANPNANLEKSIDNLVKSLFGDGTSKNLGLFGNALPAIERAITGIAKALPNLIGKITKRLPDLLKKILPPLMSATVQVFVALADALPTVMPIIVDGLVQLVTALVPHIPTILGALFAAVIQAVLALLGSLGNAIAPWLESVGQGISEWFTGLFDGIKKALGFFGAYAAKVIEGFANGFKNAIQNIRNWFASIPAFFGSVFSNITNLFKNIGTSIGKVVSGAFKAVVNGIIRFIEGFLNTPINAVNGLIDTINSVPGVDVPRLANIHLPRLAKGGVTTGSTLANIGEAGKEAVIPLEQNTENWARPLASALAEQFSEQGIGGAGITVYMTNNINNNLDADEIGRRLMTSIRRAA